MGEVIALAIKFGVAALPAILAEWGPVVAAIAFFGFMPLGHLTLGVALLLFGAFVPKLPGDDTEHVIKLGSPHHRIAVRGNTRTALLAGGLVIIAGATIEAIAAAAHAA